eukprot:scaffold18678_cov128-Isochrysis_galbana.AAC.6
MALAPGLAGGPIPRPEQMYWCLAIRSGANLRPQTAHGTRPSSALGSSSKAGRLSERPAPPWPPPDRTPPACPRPRELAAEHLSIWPFISCARSSIPHAGHGSTICARLTAHLAAWNFMASGKYGTPHDGHGVLGSGMQARWRVAAAPPDVSAVAGPSLPWLAGWRE